MKVYDAKNVSISIGGRPLQHYSVGYTDRGEGYARIGVDYTFRGDRSREHWEIWFDVIENGWFARESARVLRRLGIDAIARRVDSRWYAEKTQQQVWEVWVALGVHSTEGCIAQVLLGHRYGWGPIHRIPRRRMRRNLVRFERVLRERPVHVWSALDSLRRCDGTSEQMIECARELLNAGPS